jgi:DNA-binding MltR family transcriptional regulator
MHYTVPIEIVKANHGFTIWHPTDQFDHRAMVLRSVCELEFQCAQLLFAYFRTTGMTRSWEEAEDELFGENGMLGSLTRMVRLASYLNLLEQDEASDLRLLARLRNMYAHGRERQQFNEDPKASAVVKSLRLYKQSPTLQNHNEQVVFLSCYEFLVKRLKARAQSLPLAPSAA